MKIFAYLFFIFPLFATEWESEIVYYADGHGGWKDPRLTYCREIPNFARAGVAIPKVETVMTLFAKEGDNSDLLEEAIASIETPGAILLAPGKPFYLKRPLHLSREGVVLRGILDKENRDDPTKCTLLHTDTLTIKNCCNIGLENLHLLTHALCLHKIEKSWASNLQVTWGDIRLKECSHITLSGISLDESITLCCNSSHLLFNRMKIQNVEVKCPLVSQVVFLDSTLTLRCRTPNREFLFDNVELRNQETLPLIHSVAWIATAEENPLVDESNFCIGCSFPEKPGPKGKYLHPSSLYEAQKLELLFVP